MQPFTAELFVERYLSGVRIDTFLIHHFRNYTSWRMQRIVRAGQVLVNGIPVELPFRVHHKQRVRVRLIEPPDKLLRPEDGPLNVLFEDSWLLVVDKPPGQITHPVGEFLTGTLCNVAQAHLDRRTPLPGLLRPGLVHRLDRETSGVIVLAKEHLSHRRLSIQFQQKKVSKTYLALVEGAMERSSQTIDLPIGLPAGGPVVLGSAKPDAIDARPAKTRIDVVRRLPEHTLVQATPLTGRQHQIRIHLAEIGHPVVEDEFYARHGLIKPRRAGRSRIDEACSPADGNGRAGRLLTRHALHACRLGFAHPVTDEWCEFEAALPADLRAAIERASHPAALSGAAT